ncbi:MAG: FliA/WhiG family RNA polymerase sigma factor [Mariprofundaceae bacterium]
MNPTAAYAERAAGSWEPPSPEALLEEYLPMIRFHADQLMRRTPDSIELDDLIDSGVLGLLDAARRFDPERDIQFKTFVGWRVRGAMLDYLRAFDWMPRGLRETAKEMQDAFQALEQRHGRPAEEEEIAEYLGLSIEEYRERLNQVRCMSVVSFDDLPLHPGSDDEALGILETIAADSATMPEHQTAMNEFIDRLADAIAHLPRREQVLITLYYHEELTMKEIALVLGLTESRVSQIHSQMVLRLRAHLGLDAPEGKR